MSVRADKNQRQLNELLTHPGNDTCADCKARAPRWASWNIGIFLCVHCASIHRKIGTHITKVKSVTLDSWTKEQVESMKMNGNIKANQLYNPDERRNPPPTNSDETDRDSEMEKYIRAKYQYKRFIKPDPGVPAPLPKDPVGGRHGGVSLGGSADLDTEGIIIRAPSRAKSTPITSTSRLRSSVLASPPALPESSSVSSIPVSRPPVFGGGLSYRPSTTSVIVDPALSFQQPQPAPSASAASTYASQLTAPALQYAPPSQQSQSSISSSNPLWQDMMSLQGSPSSSVASPLDSSYSSNTGPYGSSLNVPGSHPLGSMQSPSPNANPNLNGPRSFSLPVTTSASTSNTSPFGPPNPFSQLGTSSNLGNTSMNQSVQSPTSLYPTSGGTFNPFHNMSGLGTQATGASFQSSHSGSSQSSSIGAGVGFGGMGGMGGMTGSSSLSPWGAQQSMQQNSTNPFPSAGMGGSLQPQPTGYGGYGAPSSLSTSPFTPSVSPSSGFVSSNPSSLSASMATMSLSTSPSPYTSQTQSQPQTQFPSTLSSSSTQSSFAQSMLPAHLKQGQSQTQPANGGVSTNPFGGAWNGSMGGGMNGGMQQGYGQAQNGNPYNGWGGR